MRHLSARAYISFSLRISSTTRLLRWPAALVAIEAVVVARSAEGLQLGLLQAGAEAMAEGDAVEPVSTATYTHKCYSTFCKKCY